MRNHVFISTFLLLISTGCKQTGTQTVQRPWSALTITEENKEVIKINNYDDTSSAKYYDGGSFSIRYNKVKVDSLKTYFTMAEKDTLFHLAKDIISVPANIHEYCTDFVGDLKLTIDYGEFKEPGSFRQSGEYSGVCRWDTLSEKTKQLNNILRRRIRWRTK